MVEVIRDMLAFNCRILVRESYRLHRPLETRARSWDITEVLWWQARRPAAIGYSRETRRGGGYQNIGELI